MSGTVYCILNLLTDKLIQNHRQTGREPHRETEIPTNYYTDIVRTRVNNIEFLRFKDTNI